MSENKDLQSEVRIVFVGDSQVGKSSIINRIVSDHFDEKVEHVLKDIYISPDLTINNVSYTLLDTSDDVNDKQDLYDKVKTADAAVLVFTDQEVDSFYNLQTKWLPLITEKNPSIPIFIAHNKIDLKLQSEEDGDNLPESPDAMYSNENNDIAKIVNDNDNVKVLLEISAKEGKPINNLFDYIQKYICYPIDPLFDTKSEKITKTLSRILSRIFRLFDQDFDGCLSDQELNNFHNKCFGSRLEPLQIRNLATYLDNVNHTFISHDNHDYVTLLGFKEIIRMYLVKDKPEVVWTILRTFDYNNELVYEPSLSPKSQFTPSNIQMIMKAKKQTFEFTNATILFLSHLFKYYDHNHDGCLSPDDITNLFYPLPDSLPPWTHYSFSSLNHKDQNENQDEHDFSLFFYPSCPSNTISNGDGLITLSGYLSNWSLFMRFYPYECIYSIMLLGFSQTFDDVGLLTNPKEVDAKQYDIYNRNTIHAFLFGDHEEDCTLLLKAYINKGIVSTNSPTTVDVKGNRVLTYVNTVYLKSDNNRNQQPHVLILSYFPKSQMDKALQFMSFCDICCLMFDISDSSSFDYLKEVTTQLPSDMKLIFLANNNTLPYEQSGLCPVYKEAQQYCETLQLQSPLINHSTGPKQGQLIKNHFSSILYEMACIPEACIPYGKKNKMIHRYIKLGLVGLLVGAIGLMAYYYWNSSSDEIVETKETNFSSEASLKP